MAAEPASELDFLRPFIAAPFTQQILDEPPRRRGGGALRCMDLRLVRAPRFPAQRVSVLGGQEDDSP